jgi:hypothetical protein
MPKYLFCKWLDAFDLAVPADRGRIVVQYFLEFSTRPERGGGIYLLAESGCTVQYLSRENIDKC